MILQQMQELGMKQRVFGSHRTIGDELDQAGWTSRGRLRGRLSLRPHSHRSALAGLRMRVTKPATTKSPITSPRSPTTRCKFCSMRSAAPA